MVLYAPAQNVQPGFDLSNYGVKVDADKRLIVVLATLEMAQTTDETGKTVKVINTPLSEKGEKFRQTLLQDNANLNEDLRRRISTFVLQYKKRRSNATDAEIVAPFISMAYTLTPPPEMADPVIVNELPGDLLDVLDFAPLAREFYRRSTIAAKLDDYLKTYRMYEPLWRSLTKEASWKIRRGNYERVFDQAKARVRSWERGQTTRQ
jgi:hypothetical protein